MRLVLIFYSLLIAISVFSQRGPGGVTDDFDSQKNCRLWLDASDLTDLADGDPVNVWHDKSISAVDDSAFWDPADASKYMQPTYRNSLSAGINGKPVVTYEYGGMLKIGKWPDEPASSDLNSNTNGYQTTYEQSIFVAFRTGNNVTDRQNIWEEGGYNRGFKIYIRDGFVFIAAYDDDNDPDPGSGTVPHFGFTYKRQAVQSNTTYVLSFIYNVSTTNELITNTQNPDPTQFSGMTGTLNGNPFPYQMEFGCCENDGVGGVGYHPDPIGLGGHNRTSYNENGRMTNSTANTGTRLFQGRLAELCYYAYALDDAERIIVENYLAAKYFANVIQNDKYDYESTYGDGVIGIGKESDNDTHNTSQGDNLFEIYVDNMSQAFPNNSPQYLIVGHNNSQIAWTQQNTPDTASIKRLKRVWRWDRHGSTPPNKDVKIRLYPDDIAKLPPLPPGYTRYGIMQESTSAYLPNFSAANTTVTELATLPLYYDGENITIHEATANIKKGTFFTLCAIKPTAEFKLVSDYAIEGNPPPASFSKTAKLSLNYKPAAGSGSTVGFTFVDGSAFDGVDYQSPPQSTVTFGSMATEANLLFDIVNNITADPPPTKDFKIVLDPGTSNINIGGRDTLEFSIFDDDPEPKISFVVADSSISEDAGVGRIRVWIPGTTMAPSTVRIIRPNLSVAGTAIYDTDYALSPANGWYNYGSDKRAITLTIPAGSNQNASAYFSILPDDLDEYDETIHFQLMALSGAGADAGSILEHTVTIVDEDQKPTVSFVSESSEGFEAINNPRLYINLNTPSAKEVGVPYNYIGGSATPSPNSNSDFSSPPQGTIPFQPGETEKYIELIVYSDESPEDDETIIFELDENPVNAIRGTPMQHTYTIKDYSEFEWQGVAGIGKFADNTFWMAPDAATSGAGASSIPNLSPRPINLTEDISSQRPTVSTRAAGRNNHKLIEFDGSQNLKVGSSSKPGQHPLVNSGGLYDRKSIFFVFSPEVVNSNTPQMIYEQGGGGRGLSIYIIQNKLYFYAWCASSGEPYSPWGFENNSTDQHSYGQAYVTSAINLEAGQFYVVSCHYSRNMGYTNATMPPLAGMHLYINGELQDSYTHDSNSHLGVGRIYTHTGAASIGSEWHQGRVHTSTSKGASGINSFDWFFKGKIGEFLYYNEPTMNEARVRVLHNYLASKYNIPLSGGTQDFDLNFANNTSTVNPDFNYEVAGIGQDGSAIHGDSRGRAEMRVTNPVFTQATAFLNWGNNGEELTTTWPYSNTHLPAGLTERSGKTWRFSANPTGGISTVDILIDFSEAENASVFQNNDQHLKLIVNTSGDPNDFSTADVYDALIESGNIARFNAIPITDGMYVSLANTSPIYPLPIELLSFSAKLQDNYVDLNWSTASETNNERFEIERAGEDLAWKKIGEVPGAGNSNTTLYYQEKDRQPLSGVSYYRLKQIDFDGDYKYSDVVSVVNNIVSTSDEVYIFPNPSNSGSVYVRLPYAFAKADANISIFTLSGKEVIKTKLLGDVALRELHFGDLKPGIYLVNIQTSLLNETKKLIIQ